MLPDLIIRTLQASDRDDWEVLWLAYLDFYGARLPASVTAKTFVRNLDPSHLCQQCLIAEWDGHIVGFTHYIFHAHNWRAEGVVYLQDLYADPSMRGQGIGRALIEAVYQRADDAGCSSVYWMTQEHNYVGRMLYDRVGTKTPFIKYSR
ncbi:MAG: GNAT family N-acetyltransferase [Planktomarina sp.]